MNKNKFMGFSLVFCSLVMLAGMFINNEIYWFVIDIVVIILCALNGFLILKNKDKEK